MFFKLFFITSKYLVLFINLLTNRFYYIIYYLFISVIYHYLLTNIFHYVYYYNWFSFIFIFY